jgi:hypothetical protein
MATIDQHRKHPSQLSEAELELLRAEHLACTQRSRVLKREIRLRVAELEELERRITEIDRVQDMVAEGTLR